MKKLTRVCFFVLCVLQLLPTMVIANQDSGTNPMYKTDVSVTTGVPDMERTSAKDMDTRAIEYAFPYPGMLTNNTFYFFKRLRDTIMESFMTDPLKKAEFHLLQSDKFMAMALTYQEASNWKFVHSSVQESMRTMTQSANELKTYQVSGGSIPTYLLERIQRSVAKRREVLYTMVKQAPDSYTALLQKMLDDSAHVADDVAPLSP